MNSDTEISYDPQKPLAKTPAESNEAHESFTYYFDLGPRRTLPLVSKDLDVSINTVKDWSRKHSWLDRITAYRSDLAGQRVQADQAAIQQQAAKPLPGTGHVEATSQVAKCLMDLSQTLMKHQILNNGENIPVPVILKMFQVALQFSKAAQNGSGGADQDTANATLQATVLEAIQHIQAERTARLAQAAATNPPPAPPITPDLAA